MELLQNSLKLLRDRQPEMTGVLQKAHTFIGEIKEDNGCAQDSDLPNHLNIDDVGNADESKNEHLSADALESYVA